MNLLELIDRLCAVTEEMARIIREQSFFIENCLSVDAAAKEQFAALRRPVQAELDLLEVRLRPIHGSSPEIRTANSQRISGSFRDAGNFHNTGGDAGKESAGYDELVLQTAGPDIRAADRKADGTEGRGN